VGLELCTFYDQLQHIIVVCFSKSHSLGIKKSETKFLAAIQVCVVICTGKGKPVGFAWVLVMGTGMGTEILTPEKPIPVGSGHRFFHIGFKL
jgi:hypothetical protein